MRTFGTTKDVGRDYWVKSEIRFHLNLATIAPRFSELHKLIHDVDELHPWIDVVAREKGKMYSINSLSCGRIDTSIPGEKSCYFELTPTVSNLSRSQLYAYKKYLATIAEELSKRKILSVSGVSYKLTINTSGGFSSI